MAEELAVIRELVARLRLTLRQMPHDSGCNCATCLVLARADALLEDADRG